MQPEHMLTPECRDCESVSSGHGGRKHYCELHEPRPINLVIVPENATDIAFVNGGTYTREELLHTVCPSQELLKALERQRQLLNELARTCAQIEAEFRGQPLQPNQFVVSK